MIKEKDYLNKKKFPLTTQGNLEYSSQQMIDSFNYDSIVRHVQNGDELNDDQKARVKEFEKKLGRNFAKDVKNIEGYN